MTPIIKRLELAEAALAKNGFVLVDDVWVAQPVQQPAAVVGQEPVYQVRGIKPKIGPAPWHDVDLYAFQRANKQHDETRIVYTAIVPAAGVQGDADEQEFRAARLRRAAALVGLAGAVPGSDDELLDCMGSVLGMICTEIEKIQTATAVQPDSGRDAALDDITEALEFAAQVVELFDDATMQADYMIDAGEAAGIIRALPSYLAAHPANGAQAGAHSIGHNDDLPGGWKRHADGRVEPPVGEVGTAYIDGKAILAAAKKGT